MDCRLWSLASKTFVFAALCVGAFDMSQVYAAEKNGFESENSSVRNAALEMKKTYSRQARALESEEISEGLTDVDSDSIQVAPSPKKSSASASKEQKKRSRSKRVRKLDVPSTLGANKSLRKSEKELDQIFASRVKTTPAYVQYGPGANVATQDSYSVGSFASENKKVETTANSWNDVVPAPYTETMGGVQQVNALSPETIKLTAPSRYPLFEEDALTQESVSLTDELDFSEPENLPSALERSEEHNASSGSTVSPEPLNPFVQDAPETKGKANEYLPGTAGSVLNDSSNYFDSSRSTNSRSVGFGFKSSSGFANRFARYTGLFADFEWLGWQTDSIKQTYAVSVSENNGVYDELSLKPGGIGFRGRAGLRTVYGWDLTGAYTKFDADKSGSVTGVAGTLYTSAGKNVDEISADSDVKLDIYDVEAGRWITRDKWAVRPFVGFRWTQLNQTQNVVSWNTGVAETNVAATPNATVKETESVFARSKADMYGVRLGGEGSLALFRNLSVYGRGAAMIALGDVDFQTCTTRDGTSVIRRAKKSYATPAFETAVGLVWRRGGWEVKGGYELNVWTNASALNGKSSDFAARGLFAGVAWNN